ANSHSSISRPARVLWASHRRMTHGSATHSTPPASQWAACSRLPRLIAKTSSAPVAAKMLPARTPPHIAATTAPTLARIAAKPLTRKAPPWQRRAHSQAITSAATTVRACRYRPPSQIAASATGASTSADSTRSRNAPASAGANRRSVAPLAPAIISYRLFEVHLPEIRPQRRGKHELRIGALPQQEVADPLFAAGPDQQIRVGNIGRE